jgi:hypothetical protein
MEQRAGTFWYRRAATFRCALRRSVGFSGGGVAFAVATVVFVIAES